MQCLPETDKVFFVHYQCSDFNDDEHIIHNLHIYAHGQLKQYAGNDEAEFILRYTNRVNELIESGLIPVHWSQNRYNYGPDAINERYLKLTGQPLSLDYPNSINLSEWLKEKHGDDYIHPIETSRLDKLAELNHLKGHSLREDVNSRLYPGNRTLLIKDIYKKAYAGNLQIPQPKDQVRQMEQTQIIQPVKATKADIKQKLFYEYLLYHRKEELAAALKKEFSTEIGKNIRILIEAMTDHTPPLLSLCRGQKKAFYKAMTDYFGRSIGAYNSVFEYDFDKKNDATDLEMMTNRLNHILENFNYD